jgi:osmotically-inducible protein OsmY
MQAFSIGSPAEQAAAALKPSQISDLHVEVVDGRLILRGLAGCYKTKQQASELASAAAPGMTVVNELRVAQAPADDSHLGKSVAAAIERAVPGAGERVELNAHGGVIEIHGTARNDDECCRIENAAWHTNGVMGVECHLTITSTDTHDEDVSEALAAYISRAANVPRGAVVVKYRSGIVTLSGAVASATRSQAIEDLVRWHERVIDVINHLRVAAPAEVSH